MSAAVSELFTGLPGSGKTLTVVERLDKLHKEGKDIYVHGIPELMVPHTPIGDPKEWYKLPQGSIVVFDEAQKVFPVRPSGSAVPPHVSAFETLRHSGHQAILITQHPGLIDANLRKLIGRHVHIERIMGGHWHFRYELPRVFNPEVKSEKSAAVSSRHTFDKRIFQLYKSAEIHTVKTSIPPAIKKAIFLSFIVAPLIAIGAGYYLYKHYGLDPNKAKQAQSAAAGINLPSAQPGQTGAGGDRSKHVLTVAEYTMAHVPRIPGFPQTAPYYDGVNAPHVAPKPAACLKNHSGCKCYTQQATPVYMTVDQCEAIVEHGWFDDSIEPHKDDAMSQTAQAGRVRSEPIVPNGPVAMDDHPVVVAAAEPQAMPLDMPAVSAQAPASVVGRVVGVRVR